MGKHILIDKERRFYKANLHCHSTLSDGKMTPEEIKEKYKENGYSIVAFSDHEHLIDNSHLNDENFLAMTSCEIAIKPKVHMSTIKDPTMKVFHLNLLSGEAHNLTTPYYNSEYDHFINDANRDMIVKSPDKKRVFSTRGINKLIREVNRQNFLVTMNHPNWSLINAADYLGVEGLWAVEIYNNSCVMAGHPDDERVFDELLRQGKKVFCVSADDNHDDSTSLGGYVVVNCDSLDYTTVFDSLKNGYFYASTGGEITSLTVEGDKVTFECAPAKKVSIITEGRSSNSIFAKDIPITNGIFTIKKSDGYFRLRFESERGNAYTQAFDVCEFLE